MKRGEGYFWGAEDYNGTLWFPISKELYEAIVKFSESLPDPDGVLFSDTDSM